MFKVLNGLSPPFMQDLFTTKESISKQTTRSNRIFQRQRVNTVYNGENSFRIFGPRVWDTMLPEKYKKCTSLSDFKKIIKSWVPKNCICRLCKTYLPEIGFTDVKLP